MSAENTRPEKPPVPHQTIETVSAAAALVGEQLGATPADQARTLADGLGESGFVALIEELHAYV